MGVFDQAARWAVKADPDGFFRWRIPRLLARYRFVGWLDTTLLSFPGDPDRVCDTVAEFAPFEDGLLWCLVDTEAQTDPDPDMRERFGEYGLRLRLFVRRGPGPGGKYVVVGLLLGLTGPAQPAELDATLPELDGAGLRLRLVQCAVREESARQTLERIEAGEVARCLLFWVLLMHDAGDPELIARWLRLAAREPDEWQRGDYGGIAKVFAELTPHRDAWHRALEGWNMRESQTVLQWQREARQEGELEGQRRERRAGVLRILERRFGPLVPPDLIEAVGAMTDLDRLASWFDAALTSPDLAAFRAAVGSPPAAGANGVHPPT